MARLRILGPNGVAQQGSYQLGPRLTLGRSEECDIVLADEAASRHHARIVATPAGYVLEDQGSANGTFVGRNRVTRHALRPGETFRIGDTLLRFDDEALPGAAGQPAFLPPPADIAASTAQTPRLVPPTAEMPEIRADAPAIAAEEPAFVPPPPGIPPSPPPRPKGRSWLPFVGVGCLGAVAFVALLGLGGAIVWWYWPEAGAPLPSGDGSAAGGGSSPEPTAPEVESGSPSQAESAVLSVPPDQSMPPDQSDILRFTIRLATNPVLTGCASMPEEWTAADLTLGVEARVGADGSFQFEKALGQHSISLTGTWRDEALEASGRWTSDGPGGQRDEGTFEVTGRRVLGTWFGNRMEAKVASQLGDASCVERIDNGLSTVNDLVW